MQSRGRADRTARTGIRPLWAATAGLGLLAACGGKTEIPLEVGTDQLVIALSTVDGRPQAALLSRTPGRPFEIDSDSDQPIYTWVIDPNELIDASGQPLPNEALSTAKARFQGDPADNVGDCGRCAYLANHAPQVVNPGDSCPVPSFTKGAIWQPEDGGRVCRATADGTLCGPGGDLDRALLDDARSKVRLEWPGECACRGPVESPSRRDLDIRPIAPAGGAAPIAALAQTAEGLVAGISRYNTFLYDPRTDHTEERPVEIDLTIQTAFALANGDILTASESFNTGWTDNTTFHRFRVENGALSAPQEITSEATILPNFLSYLAPASATPLWIAGQERSATNYDPAIYACDDRNLGCQQVPIQRCRRAGYYGGIGELRVLDNGVGVARSDQVLYYKGARPPPQLNPSPMDPWICAEPAPRTEWRAPSTEASVAIGHLGALTTVGNRVFVCAETVYENCQPNYAVILTATVTAEPNRAPEPTLEVVYRGGDWSRCRRFLDVPGQRGVRALLSGQRIVDFDEAGNKVGETDLPTAYGAVSGLQAIEQAQPGALLARATEHRIYVATGTATPFRQAYGPTQTQGADYDVLIALDDGDFYAFGNPQGLLKVHVTPTGEFPQVDLQPVPDLAEALLTSDDLRTGVLDRSGSTSERTRILVGGKRGGAPYLARYGVGADGLQEVEVLALPPGLGDVAVQRIAEIGPSNFLAVLEGSAVFAIRGSQVDEVQIDYDDPTTPDTEARPTRNPDACTRVPPRLDLWRAVGGNHGVGWLVGTDGLVIRVGGIQGTRFLVPEARGLTLTAVDATCPDQALFGGQGRQLDSSGSEIVRLQLFRTYPVTETPEGQRPEPRDLGLRRIGRDELDSLALYPIFAGTPRALLPETVSGNRGGEPPFAVMLDNGFVHRMFSSDRLRYTRAPFEPRAVAASPKGWILFGTWESRLALGVPR